MDLSRFLRDVPDFPKPGILFKDITPLLADHGALTHAIDQLAAPWRDQGITAVAGIESRGFLFGPGIAERLGCGFVPIRKPGKLPWKTRSRDYSLEYGTNTIEIHEDAVGTHDSVLVVDDLLATGGTVLAAIGLIEDLGATVAGAGFVVELSFLEAAGKLTCPYQALITI